MDHIENCLLMVTELNWALYNPRVIPKKLDASTNTLHTYEPLVQWVRELMIEFECKEKNEDERGKIMFEINKLN